LTEKEMPVLTLANEGKTIDVPGGANLRKTLLRHGIRPYVGKDRFLNCLGNGLCGTCRVEVVGGKGAPPISPREEAALAGLTPFYVRQIPQNVRLSCRIDISSDITVKTYPRIGVDWQLTKERLTLNALWTFFCGIFLLVMIRLLLEIATGR
jgi:ferredoxin